MTRIWLVRHAPTHAKTMIGWTDMAADFSDTAAFSRLDRALPAGARVISSDLSRAVNTADKLMNTRLRLPHDPRLREIHFGAWEARGFAEVEAETPTLIRAFWEQPGDILPPQGESWNVLHARVWEGIEDLRDAYPTQDIVVVAHFGAILAAIAGAAKITASAAFAHKIDNLSITHIHHDGMDWHIGPINLLP